MSRIIDMMKENSYGSKTTSCFRKCRCCMQCPSPEEGELMSKRKTVHVRNCDN